MKASVKDVTKISSTQVLDSKCQTSLTSLLLRLQLADRSLPTGQVSVQSRFQVALLLTSLLLARLRQWQEMAGTVRGSIPAKPALCLCLSELVSE